MDVHAQAQCCDPVPDLTDERKMGVNNAGQWVGQVEANKFDRKSIIYEGLNNLVHSSKSVLVKIMSGVIQILDTEYKTYSFTETGGSGFGDAQTFQDAVTWGSSIQKGLNNFGTGMKGECMVRETDGDQVYKVIKCDTSLLKGVSWSSDGTPDLPHEKDISGAFIREKMLDAGERKTMAIWGLQSDKVSDELLIENIPNIKTHTDESILSEITRRYGRCSSAISYNGCEIVNDDFFEESSAKTHPYLPDKTMYDTMTIRYYEQGGNSAIECIPDRVFHKKQGTFCVSSRVGKFTMQKKCKPVQETEPIAEITMQIMEHSPTNGEDGKVAKMFPLVKYNVHCEMSEPGKEGIIFCEQKWNSDWGKEGSDPIHLLLKGSGEWLDKTPNKTRTRVKEDLMDLITKMVNGYYLTGSSKDSPAFHDTKDPKMAIPPETRLSEIGSLEAWQSEQEYFIQRNEPGFFKCMCCHCLLSQKTTPGKTNSCAMGHIKSAKSFKDEGVEDDVSSRNIIPICEHCNSNMGTIHMTDYIKTKFGRKSDNYKQYRAYCNEEGKQWQHASIDEMDETDLIYT